MSYRARLSSRTRVRRPMPKQSNLLRAPAPAQRRRMFSDLPARTPTKKMGSAAAAETEPRPLRQHGQILVAVAFIISIATAAALYTFLNPSPRYVEEQKNTARALAMARDALIGRAAGDDNRP